MWGQSGRTKEDGPFFQLSQFEIETTGGITRATMNQGPADMPPRKDFIESNSLTASLLQLILRYYFPSTGIKQLTQISPHQPLA